MISSSVVKYSNYSRKQATKLTLSARLYVKHTHRQTTITCLFQVLLNDFRLFKPRYRTIQNMPVKSDVAVLWVQLSYSQKPVTKLTLSARLYVKHTHRQTTITCLFQLLLNDFRLFKPRNRTIQNMPVKSDVAVLWVQLSYSRKQVTKLTLSTRLYVKHTHRQTTITCLFHVLLNGFFKCCEIFKLFTKTSYKVKTISEALRLTCAQTNNYYVFVSGVVKWFLQMLWNIHYQFFE